MLRRVIRCLFAAAGSVACLAQAGTVTNVVYAPEYNPSCVPGVETYALRVTADTDWISARINIELSEGEMIHVPTPAIPEFGDPGGLPTPEVQFVLGESALPDTGVIMPNPPGKITDPRKPNLSPGFTETPTLFNVGWFGDPRDQDDIGVFDIAVFAFTQDAIGSITGTIFSSAGEGLPADEERLFIASAAIGPATGLPPTDNHDCVPEPGIGLLGVEALIGVALIGSRHRRSSRAARQNVGS